MKIKLYKFKENEKFIATISRKTFEKIFEIAREMDLDEGGLYDARGGGAINIWVSLEDKPKDWFFPITKGKLKYPREYLATLYPEFLDSKVRIYLTITNYAREHWAEENKDNLSYEEYIYHKNLVRVGSKEEWEWAEEKVKYLFDLADLAEKEGDD